MNSTDFSNASTKLMRLRLPILFFIALALAPIGAVGETMAECRRSWEANDAAAHTTARLASATPTADAQQLSSDCTQPQQASCKNGNADEEFVSQAVLPNSVDPVSAPVAAPLPSSPPKLLGPELIARVDGSRAPPVSTTPLFILHRALLI